MCKPLTTVIRTIEYAETVSNNAAAKKCKVDVKRIRESRKKTTVDRRTERKAQRPGKKKARWRGARDCAW